MTPARLWNVRAAPWWQAPAGEQFHAYYMNLRVHYDMPAAEALAYARVHRTVLGLDRPGGFMETLRAAINPPRP